MLTSQPFSTPTPSDRPHSRRWTRGRKTVSSLDGTSELLSTQSSIRSFLSWLPPDSHDHMLSIPTPPLDASVTLRPLASLLPSPELGARQLVTADSPPATPVASSTIGIRITRSSGDQSHIPTHYRNRPQVFSRPLSTEWAFSLVIRSVSDLPGPFQEISLLDPFFLPHLYRGFIGPSRVNGAGLAFFSKMMTFLFEKALKLLSIGAQIRLTGVLTRHS